VICLESELEPRSRVQDLVAVSRLGTTVKKTVLFSWLEGREVKYNSVTRGAPR
jgi:tRNA splicing endonuclease